MNRGIIIIGVIVAAILSYLIGALIAYFLWNRLMPTIFNLPKITLLQGLGMIILFRLFISPSTVKFKGE